MQFFSRTLLLSAALCLPLAAHASSMDLITITGSLSGPSQTWTLTVPSAPTPVVGDPYSDSFQLDNVPVTGPGYSSLDTVFFYDTLGLGGLWDPSVPNSLLDFYGTTLFNDDLVNPVFTLGSGTLLYYVGPGSVPFDYSITPIPGPVPEPSSLLLLGTGAAGLLAALRRRLFA